MEASSIIKSEEVSMQCSVCSTPYYVQENESWKKKCLLCYTKTIKEGVEKICLCGDPFMVKPGEEKWKKKCYRCTLREREDNNQIKVVCDCGRSFYVNAGDAKWKKTCVACYKALKKD